MKAKAMVMAVLLFALGMPAGCSVSVSSETALTPEEEVIEAVARYLLDEYGYVIKEHSEVNCVIILG